jgi:hypothetical protein
MAQQPYMGSGLLFPRLLGRAHSIDPDVTARVSQETWVRNWV